MSSLDFFSEKADNRKTASRFQSHIILPQLIRSWMSRAARRRRDPVVLTSESEQEEREIKASARLKQENLLDEKT